MEDKLKPDLFTLLPCMRLCFLFVLLHKDSIALRLSSEGLSDAAPQPYFGSVPTNQTFLSGQLAYMPCRVHSLGNRSVTWMRGRDLHILTVGLATYSADSRFQVLHSESTDDWTLLIQKTIPKDSGVYKCQVNSDPKIVRNVYLRINDKKLLEANYQKHQSGFPHLGNFFTSIPGPVERYLEAGSSLTIDCIVRHTKSAPTTVLWYFNKNALDYDSPRGGISLQLEKSVDQTTSRLNLAAVRQTDSGNYSCVPVNAPSATVSVHVKEDELGAAVHQGGIGSGGASTSTSIDRNTFWLHLFLSFFNLVTTFNKLFG